MVNFFPITFCPPLPKVKGAGVLLQLDKFLSGVVDILIFAPSSEGKRQSSKFDLALISPCD